MDTMDRINQLRRQLNIPDEPYPGNLHDFFDRADRITCMVSRCSCSSATRTQPKRCCKQWRGIGARLALHEHVRKITHPPYFHLGAEAEHTG